MDDEKEKYILDSFALLAYFYGEPGGPTVRKLLHNASQIDGPSLYMSMINVGEIYYLTFKSKDQQAANTMMKELRELPITIFQAADERVIAAATIKAQYRVSYADAFAIALAQEFDCPIVTGDPEFKGVESLVEVFWI